jgi:tetratricopeptide (TPR) repeat protein
MQILISVVCNRKECSMAIARESISTARRAVAAVSGLTLVAAAGCSHRSATDYIKQGDQAVQSSHLAEAETDYQRAEKMDPNNLRAHIALGNLYVFEQKPGPAELEYMKVLELAPNNAEAHAALGGLYVSQAQQGLGEAQYRAAVVLQPANVSYRISLGNILQKETKNREAEAEFRTAVGLQPKNAHAHLALANLLDVEPNRQGEAQAEYAQVKALDPSLMPANLVTTAPSPAPAMTPASANPVAAAPLKIRDINRKFRLTHNSPVYQSTSSGSPVVAQVHHGKWVHVTGMAGQNWLRIRMRNGTVGFIPVTAAE